jgi:hypothetical protein
MTFPPKYYDNFDNQQKNTHEQEKHLASRVRQSTRFHLDVSLMSPNSKTCLINAEGGGTARHRQLGSGLHQEREEGNLSATFLFSDNSHAWLLFPSLLFYIDYHIIFSLFCQALLQKNTKSHRIYLAVTLQHFI